MPVCSTLAGVGLELGFPPRDSHTLDHTAHQSSFSLLKKCRQQVLILQMRLQEWVHTS